MANVNALAAQIQEDRIRKENAKQLERAFHKTHFGPEETEEQLYLEQQRIRLQKEMQRLNLIDQITTKTNMKYGDFNSERSGDLNNLRTCQNMFVAEERARQAKIMKEK